MHVNAMEKLSQLVLVHVLSNTTTLLRHVGVMQFIFWVAVSLLCVHNFDFRGQTG